MKSKVTSKGQITIPHEIREKTGIITGSQLDFQIVSDDTILVRLISHDVIELKGIVKSKRKKAPSWREIKQAIVDNVAKGKR